MNEMITDWDDLRLFLAVARTGGLASATRITGKSAPTLGRRMLALERRLGRDLFHRLPRGYELTEDGRAYLAQVEAVEAQLLPLTETEEVLPLIKISAGTWGTELLCRHINHLVASDPVRIRFIAAEDVLDIGRREALIGLRNHRPDTPALATRRAGRVEFAVYATSPQIAPWVKSLGTTPSARWLEQIAGAAPMIEVTSPRNALDIARTGAAKAVLPTFIGDREAELMRISNPIEALAHDRWLALHNEDRFIPEVRRVIDRIVELLSRGP